MATDLVTMNPGLSGYPFESNTTLCELQNSKAEPFEAYVALDSLYRINDTVTVIVPMTTGKMPTWRAQPRSKKD